MFQNMLIIEVHFDVYTTMTVSSSSEVEVFGGKQNTDKKT